MISIVTPVYNGERFIKSCLNTVLDQQCSEIEHIIVDGGSSDKTVEIIQQYANKNSHIRYISEKDQGQSDAMNKGITLAKGDILAILNVDDYYEPNTLNRVLELFKTLPEPSFLAGNCNIWDADNNLIGINKPAKLTLKQLLLGWNTNQFPANPSAYFYHTALHKNVGFYNINDHYTMDLDFILRAVQVAHLTYIDETWGNFRQHRDTKTFQSNASGQASLRVEQLMKHYRKSLSPLEKLKVSIAYEVNEKKKIEEIYGRLRRIPSKLLSLKELVKQ